MKTLAPSLVFKRTFTKNWEGIGEVSEGWRLPRKIRNYLQTRFGHRAKRVAICQQLHGTQMKVIKEKTAWPKGGYFPAVDGLITNRKDILLAVKHADCVPIFLFDPKKKVISLMHSGWKGTIGKIGLVAVEQMMAQFGSRVRDIQVFLGPAAQCCCYTKPKESIFSYLPEWQKFIRKRNGELKVDLPGFIRKMFLGASIAPQNLECSRICTVHSRAYFSWTRQRDQGKAKMMGVSMLGLL